jgi:hypothetical protein
MLDSSLFQKHHCKKTLKNYFLFMQRGTPDQ